MRKAQKLTRVLSLVLVLSLCFGLLATSGLKLTAKAAGETTTKWQKITSVDELKPGADGKAATVILAATHAVDSKTYTLKNVNASKPAVVELTLSADGNTITGFADETVTFDDVKWEVECKDNTFAFKRPGSNAYLYPYTDGTDMKIGEVTEDIYFNVTVDMQLTMKINYKGNELLRYVGINNKDAAKDWRHQEEKWVSNLGSNSYAIYKLTESGSESGSETTTKWQKITSVDELKPGADGKAATVILAATHAVDNKTYTLKNVNASKPAVVELTLSADGNTITGFADETVTFDDVKWEVECKDNTFAFKRPGSNAYLYPYTDGTDMKIGEVTEDIYFNVTADMQLTMKINYKGNELLRYVGINNKDTAKDWRHQEEKWVSNLGSNSYAIYKLTETTEPACKHETVKVDEVAATCTTEGKKTTTCTVCNTVIKTETIPALGHTDANNNGICDTCKTDLTAISTIAGALAAADGAEVKDLTGHVAFITGKSVWLQDENGENAICVRVTSYDTSDQFKVGDLLKVASAKISVDKDYGTQISMADDTKITKEDSDKKIHTVTVTVDKLDTVPVHTYLTISDELTIKAIEQWKDKNNKEYTNVTLTKGDVELKVFKAVIDPSLKVGDKVLFSGVREEGQLRNTHDTEIKLVSAGTTTPGTDETEKPGTDKPEDKPAETKDQTFVLATEVKDGDKIILVHATTNKAVSSSLIHSESNGKDYLAGVTVTPNSSKVTTDNAAIVWTVKAVDGGYQLVNAKGETISCTSGLAYGDKDNVWAFEFDNKTLYIKSTTATGSSGDPKYIEWYDQYNEFSTYYKSDKNADLFAFNVYVLDPDATPVKPSGNPGTADNAQLVLAGVVMVMAVAAAAALVTQRKKSF